MTDHTKGPWMAASRPSSVVGLPVVSQSGRSIASVTHFKLGKEFDNHDRESAANARLIANAPDLLAALTELSAMYGHAWDRVDGGLSMFGSSVERFEKAHYAAQVAIAAAKGEPPPVNCDDEDHHEDGPAFPSQQRVGP